MSTIKNGKLTKSVINKIRTVFAKNLTSIAIGKTWLRVTQHGGVHYTGRKIETNSVFFELGKSDRYLVIALYEYPKGIIVHFFNPTAQKSFSSDERNEVFETLKEILIKEK